MTDATSNIATAGSARTASRPVLIHIHIPKTSGTTINKVLCDAIGGRNFSHGPKHADMFTAMSQAERDSIDFLFGHFPYGLHEAFTRPVRYVACVREPRQRLLSLYRYVLARDVHPLHGLIKNEARDFTSFLRLALRTPAIRNRVDNLQVRMIGGRMDVRREYADVLQTALSHLTTDNFFVGDLARLSDFLASLESKLHVKFGALPKLNSLQKNTSFEEELQRLAPDASGLLERFTEWDALLYERARQDTFADLGRPSPSANSTRAPSETGPNAVLTSPTSDGSLAGPSPTVSRTSNRNDNSIERASHAQTGKGSVESVGKQPSTSERDSEHAIFVHSHRRSGTHFLIDTIRAWFDVSKPLQNRWVRNAPYSVSKDHEPYVGFRLTQRHLWGSPEEFHQARCLYATGKHIYIVRNPLQVLRSQYIFDVSGAEPKFKVDPNTSFREYLTGASLHEGKTGLNRIDYWVAHVKSWYLDQNTLPVIYDELKTALADTLAAISNHIGLPVRQSPRPVSATGIETNLTKKFLSKGHAICWEPATIAAVRSAIERELGPKPWRGLERYVDRWLSDPPSAS